MEADEKRLRQVLINLLGNAVKFTDQGNVTFKVMALEENEQRNEAKSMARLRFEIQDTGVGMTESDQTKIFLPFEQVGSVQRKREGTGLGLAITQQIIALMGSTIQVKSQLGKGSLFWFDLMLPIGTTIIEDEQTTAGYISGYNGPAYRILVVDDNLENRLVLENMLVPLGFEIIQAENGQQCVDLACQMKPDLILTDLVMPIMTGFEAVKLLRQVVDLEKTPIIAVSASAFEMDKQRSQAVGCNDFLPKPVDREKLLILISTYLNIEWIYNQEQQENVIGSEPTMLVFPPKEELAILYELAVLGKLSQIKKRTNHLKHADEKLIPFVDKVQNLAIQFEDETIMQMLEEHL